MTGWQIPSADDIEDVRVVPAGARVSIPDEPERSHWQKRRDDDLAEIEAKYQQARDLIADATEGLTNYTTPQHRNLELLVNQQIEQVIEFRRVRQ